MVEQALAWQAALLFNLGFCSFSLDRANPVMLGFQFHHRQVLGLAELLHALENISDALESARLRVVKLILVRLASVSP